MGRIAALRCPQCGWEAVTDDTFACGSCEAVLEVRMDLGHLTRSDVRIIRSSADNTLWRWFDFFPVKSRGSVVSLGEGYTPLMRCRRLGEHLGMERLYVKNDTLLPTGSLKDRSNSVGISRAVELGFDTVAVPSTGNAAASVAAYAAAAGLRSVVMVPAGTDAAKVTQAYACGAEVVTVEGESRRHRPFYREAVKEFGWYDCLSTNPYRNEGKKSYAFELFDQLDEHVPNWIIHPTAGGAGLVAMWKGYQELHGLGWVHRFPRLVAAQSEAAAPIAAALKTNSATVEPVAAGATVAESIRVGNPMRWGCGPCARCGPATAPAWGCRTVRSSRPRSLLGRLAGVFAEPLGRRVAGRGRMRLRREGVIRADDMVVCNITGHGLKQVASVAVPPEQLDSRWQPEPGGLESAARVEEIPPFVG